MKKGCIAIVTLLGLLGGVNVRAQESPQEGIVVPLEVEIVISRFEGDKRISSVPYIMAVNAAFNRFGITSALNMQTDVPVPAGAFVVDKRADATPLPPTSFNYRPVGTSIEAAASANKGQFQLRLTINERSVYAAADLTQSGVAVAGVPVFRNFHTNNTLLLTDGQTRQFTAATDRVTGEVVRVDVTLRVVK